MSHPDPLDFRTDFDGCPITLWAVLWSSTCLSILSSATAATAEQQARDSRGNALDRWPGTDVEPFTVRPVDFLELGVASRMDLNEPRLGRFDVGGKTISWMGPESAARFRRPDATADWIAKAARPTVPPHYCLWSYVWSRRELILFTARDAAAALRWARKAGPGKASRADIEPVEDLLLQLKPHEGGYAPTCYRVWIDGFKVGWPPTDVQLPPRTDEPPEGPLAAEARLPIPTYSRVKPILIEYCIT